MFFGGKPYVVGVQNDEDEEDEEGPSQDHGGGERKADFAIEKTKK